MKNFWILLLGIITTFPACVHEDFESTLSSVALEPEYSLPLGTFYVPLDTSFSEDNYQIKPTDIVTVVFNGKPYLTSAYFEKYDTVTFNVQLSHETKDHIISITFHMVVSNWYPTNVATQVYFMDMLYNKIDSAITDHTPLLLKKAPVNNEGIVVSPYVQTIEIPFSGNRLNNLLNTSYFSLYNKVYYYDGNNSSVKFFTSNKIEIVTGIRLKLKATVNETY